MQLDPEWGDSSTIVNDAVLSALEGHFVRNGGRGQDLGTAHQLGPITDGFPCLAHQLRVRDLEHWKVSDDALDQLVGVEHRLLSRHLSLIADMSVSSSEGVKLNDTHWAGCGFKWRFHLWWWRWW